MTREEFIYKMSQYPLNQFLRASTFRKMIALQMNHAVAQARRKEERAAAKKAGGGYKKRESGGGSLNKPNLA